MTINGWSITELTLMVGGVVGLYLASCFLSREKDATRLATVWRAYAERAGDRVSVPGRYSFLLPQTTQVHAKLEGTRHGVAFTAEITEWDPEEPGEKDTTFTSSPSWLPDNSGISITRGEPGGSWPFKTPEPTLRRHRLNVYASPPELASAFDTADGQKLLADFAKLPATCEAKGWRKNSHAKYHGAASIMFITLDEWCDDPDQLDAIIDVLTRLCTLNVNAAMGATHSAARRSS